ncbi:MAG TPA: hypothetical protein VGH98_07360 [Gemmatimonadaceae bacterium]
MKLPKYQAQVVAFRLACAERDEAFAKSGLPTCRWTEQWEREAPASDASLESRIAYGERAALHAKMCTICQAREKFEKEHFPDMPQLPVAGWMRVLGSAANWVEARPEWTRPAIYGAAILAAVTSVRAVFMLLGAVRQPRLLLPALGAIVLASAGGAGGGLVYSLIGRPVRRVPVLGPYLAGIITVCGYLGSVLMLMTVAGDRRELTKNGMAESLVTFGLVSIFFGLIVGHLWFRQRRDRSQTSKS